MTINRSTLLKIVSSIIGIVTLLYFLLPRYIYITPWGPIAVQLSRIKALGLVLDFYAETHNGKFPDKLADLAGQISNDTSSVTFDPDLLYFYDPETHKPSDWIYFPGHILREPADTILAASPVMVWANRQIRLVLRFGTDCEIANESDFQEQIKKQLHRK